jgi:hypothetical protein
LEPTNDEGLLRRAEVLMPTLMPARATIGGTRRTQKQQTRNETLGQRFLSPLVDSLLFRVDKPNTPCERNPGPEATGILALV